MDTRVFFATMAGRIADAFRCVAASVLVVLGVWLHGATAWAADFRVDNQVFLGDERQPAVRSTTIFLDDVVYDYLLEPAEITVFNPSAGRFTLLNLDRQVRTELPLQTIRAALETLKRRAVAPEGPPAAVLWNPTFQQQVDPSSGAVVFKSEWMTYRVLGALPDDPEAARQYRVFSDAYARLNTFLRPQSRPPTARLIVNEAIQKRGEMPIEVEMTVALGKGSPGRCMTVRSRHQLVARLDESDRRRVAEANEHMKQFKSVGFAAYEASSTQ